jgi:hypothetical protein
MTRQAVDVLLRPFADPHKPHDKRRLPGVGHTPMGEEGMNIIDARLVPVNASLASIAGFWPQSRAGFPTDGVAGG